MAKGLVITILTILLNAYLYSGNTQTVQCEVALRGAWHEEDAGEKTRYNSISGTKAIYRQIDSPPNLLYTQLPDENTFLTDDMGMAAFEVDRLGNVVWERKLYGETYFGIIPLNENEILLNILSKNKMIRLNKKSDTEAIIKEGQFRDIAITNKGEILTAEAIKEGKVLIMNESGAVTWESCQAFLYPRGVCQKRNENILVVDFNHKAYEIDYDTRNIIWEMSDFYYPNSIEEMENGNYLITDEHNNRIIEVEPLTKNIVRSFSDGLWAPNYARELDNGDWLICDTDNHRIIQINDENESVWELSNLHTPNRATR